MQVRLTTEADLERVMEIYHGAQAFMAAHGNPTQWRNAYPTPEIVREDIALCRGYVCEENGHLYAAFMAAGRRKTPTTAALTARGSTTCPIKPCTGWPPPASGRA